MKRYVRYLGFALIPVTVGLAAYLLALTFRPVQDISGTALQNPIDIHDIRLTDLGGENFSFEKLESKLTLVFFGFTNCPDMCPLTLHRLGNAYRALGEPDDLQVVFITVDPDDDPLQVQQYATSFHPRSIGLSGTNSDLASVAKRFFVAANNLGDRQFVHTEAVYVVNKQGKIIWIFSNDDLINIDDDIATLLKV